MNKEEYITLLIDSLIISEARKDTVNIIRFSSVLTTAMHGSKMRISAKKYADIACHYAEKYSDPRYYAEVCNRLGMLNFSLRNNNYNDTIEYLTMCNAAIYWHKRAIELGKSHNNRITQGWGQRGVISVLIDMEYRDYGDFLGEVEARYDTILTIVEQEGDNELFIHSSKRYADYKIWKNELSGISQIIERISLLQKELNVAPNLAYYNLVHDYIASTYDLDTLLILQKLAFIEMDKEMAAEHTGKLHEMDQKFEVSQTKVALTKTKDDLRSSNQQLYFASFAIAMFLILAGYLFFLYQKNRRLSLRNELLLKEQNHRVKNNLQMISSLLSLQSQKLLSTDAKEALTDSQARVNSVALLHRMLYEGEQVGFADVATYLRSLTDEVKYASHRELEVQLEVTEGLTLKMERATSLGLIINELMTNSIKHANTEGLLYLSIVIKESDDQILLDYRDNGADVDLAAWENSDSFGNQLIKIQSEQMNGKYQVGNSEGFNFNLRIVA